MNKEERGIEINLLELVKKILVNAKYIVLVTCIFGIIGYVASAFFMTPIYQAGAKLMVNVSSDQNKNMTNDQYNVSRNLVETYAVILRSRDVLNNALQLAVRQSERLTRSHPFFLHTRYAPTKK